MTESESALAFDELLLAAALDELLSIVRTSTDSPVATTDIYYTPAEQLRIKADRIEKHDAIIERARRVLATWREQNK